MTQPLKSEAMEIRKITLGYLDTNIRPYCEVCLGPMPWGEEQVEVGPRAENAKPEESFRMCQPCAVTALRRVWEYCGLYRDGVPAHMLVGMHPVRRG